jgi:predicted DNA-binding transcriptional regulator AlpA
MLPTNKAELPSRNRLMTVSEVAHWLTISPAWVRDHGSGRRKPILPSIRLGKALRFRESDIEDFLRTVASGNHLRGGLR